MTEIIGFFVIVGFLALSVASGGPVEPDASAISEAPAGADTELVEAAPEVNMGKFTTAEEVRPILGMTQANWIAVREFDGKDLLYFTHLESWRCGLSAIEYSVNGGAKEPWVPDPCYIDEPAPNAMKMENGHLPYRTYPLKSIETVEIFLTYDDGAEESAMFERKNVMTP